MSLGDREVGSLSGSARRGERSGTACVPTGTLGHLARLALLAPALLVPVLASAAKAPPSTAAVTSDLRAALDASRGPVLYVVARRGDGWWSLTERLVGDGRRHGELSAANDGDRLVAGRLHVVPPSLWPDGIGPRVLQALLAADRPTTEGWHHVVSSEGLAGRAESPWSIARTFTGAGRNHVELGLPPGAIERGLRPGDTVVIPWSILPEHLRPAANEASASSPGLEAAGADAAAPPPPAESAEPESDGWDDDQCPVPGASHPYEVRRGSRSDDGLLTYDVDGDGPHAVYRLGAGETLYSHVVLRFTDLLSGRCVNDAASRFARRSGIRDVTDIPVGWRVRIPLAELRPEFLPADHPRRLAREAEQRAAAAMSVLPPRKDLEGVHVVLDAGHGGLDPGARSGKVWEDDYAYDLACRVKALLEDRTHATVHPLVADRSTGHAPLARIRRDTDEVLLTNPPLGLDQPGSSKVPVNLRWLLANSIRRDLVEKGVDDADIVFLSVHADSLHETARGAMAYYPQGSLRKERQGVHWASYSRFREATPANAFTMTRQQALRSEGLSRSLAEAMIARVGERGLPVHRFQPVRGHVVRGGKWIPAVLRYNRIQTAVLLEAVNLNNPEDQINLRDPAFRQALAEAFVEGLTDHFEGEGGS